VRRVIGLAVAGVFLAGCGAGEPAAGPTTAPATTPPATTAPPPPPTTTAPATTAAPPAATVDGPCPYADAETVAGIVGQRISRTTVTRTRPHPGCAFYRGNGEKAADIAVSVLPDAAAAKARALAVPGAAANPVDTVGDGGAVAITDGGALLAVSKGPAVVVVRINQRISLEAVEIAKLVVASI
jgi:UPF0176 protein